MPKNNEQEQNQNEDRSYIRNSPSKAKKQKRNKRHNEKKFMDDVKDLQDDGYDVDYIENFEKW